MKRVSTNHPSLRGAQCYDCGDDTAQHGYIDHIDSAFFCQKCHDERIDQLLADEQYVPLRERKEAILRRRWPNYHQRIRNRQRQLFLGSLILLTVASLSDNFWYVCGAGTLVMWSMIPYYRSSK